MGILSRMIDSIAPEVMVEVRDVRRPKQVTSVGSLDARRQLREQRISDGQMHELIGACRGVVADGVVVEPEARFLLDWLQHHRESAGEWPHNFLYERIARILADGKVTDAEELELLDTIAKVTDAPVETRVSIDDGSGQGADALPYDVPARIDYEGREFCVAGQFVYGPRSEVEALITGRAGKLVREPSAKTNYVLVGSVGSRRTMRVPDARKIEKALQLREKGASIALVAERHWVKFV